MKFVCDEMLGTLAKWLRIFGYDTKYVKNVDDEDILKIANEENRIILTRDKFLARKAKKAVYINERELERQIRKVFQELNLKINKDRILSRCTICNVPVEKIDKKLVEKKVPEYVFKNNDEFWICKKCGRIYWMGSHWENMEKTIEKIMNDFG